jgi:hypothetical protein
VINVAMSSITRSPLVFMPGQPGIFVGMLSA